MRAYERFLDYVRVHTTSTEETGTHPSFKGEFDLADLLVDELRMIGVTDVKRDENCYVYACLPATEGCENGTPIGFLAHMDTAPDASGKDVHPMIHKDYDGGELQLGDSGRVLSPKLFPFLSSFKGETLITSDGTTLLGADDKAGVAEIMTAVETLIDKNIPHGPLFISFTPDEEIGEGTDCFDHSSFKAKYAYTVDGGDVDCLEYENFNAASATVTFKGLSVHPGDAKNKMINAQNAAMEFHALLPYCERPEHTEQREGFYHLTSMQGSVSEAVLTYIVRDHDKAKFEAKKEFLAKAVLFINAKYGEGTASLSVHDSYYNMLEKITPHMHLVENAKEAIRSVGLTPVVVPVRGGTDGARLSYEGLPCPNLGTGGANYHGEYECITVERMDKAVDVILKLIEIYGNTSY